jgi:hypothetical protein
VAGADVGPKPSKLVEEMPTRRGRGVRLFSSLVCLLSLSLLAIAQNGPIAYWSLPDERVDALVLQVPADDHGRYRELWDEFTGLHCPPDALQRQPTGKEDAGNLICTLPGKEAGLIVVVARYDHPKRTVASRRWSEAIMLPLLYNALQAQPRAHTFVFAALNGEAGERTFFDDLRKNGSRPVNALVVLDDLGRSTPFIYTPKPEGFSKKSHELAMAMGLLESEAIAAARLQRLPNPRTAFLVVNDSILTREYDTPSILIFSSAASKSFTEAVSGPAFRQGFNFAAYFLCLIDLKVPA